MRPLITSILIIAVLANSAPLLAAQTPTRGQEAAGKLDNAGLEAMLDAGLAPGVIAAKIKSSACSFDTSADALRRLKAKGATDEVLLAVVHSIAAPHPTGTQPSAPLPPPASTRAPASASTDAPPAALRVVVPAGTPVQVEAASSINSAEVRAGDTLRFRVVRPVEIGGVIVIARGAVATARVVVAKKGRPFGKAGRLSFEMLDVDAADGRKIPLAFAESLRGDSKGGTVATAIVITSLFVFPVAPLWGFKRGKSAIVPAGKIFAAAVRADTHVETRPKP
jgi:hypothetical protein